MFAENIAGHLKITLGNFAEALGDEVESERMTTAEVMKTSRFWIEENPKRFFSRLKLSSVRSLD